jgi:hypothetical protein
MTDIQTAVGTSIVVDAPIERAFAVFTEDMDSWWPKEHHILQAPLARMVFEPASGGDIYNAVPCPFERRATRPAAPTSRR